MKQYYPIILSKMLWAYQQIGTILIGFINNKTIMDDVTRFIGVAIRVYSSDAKCIHDPPASLDEIRITKRLVKIINNHYLKCLKNTQLDYQTFKQCKKIVNGYIKDQLHSLTKRRDT